MDMLRSVFRLHFAASVVCLHHQILAAIAVKLCRWYRLIGLMMMHNFAACGGQSLIAWAVRIVMHLEDIYDVEGRSSTACTPRIMPVHSVGLHLLAVRVHVDDLAG